MAEWKTKNAIVSDEDFAFSFVSWAEALRAGLAVAKAWRRSRRRQEADSEFAAVRSFAKQDAQPRQQDHVAAPSSNLGVTKGRGKPSKSFNIKEKDLR